MDRIQDELIRLGCPDFADVFVGRETAEGLEPAGVVVGCQKVGEVSAELTMVFIVEAFDGRLLDRAVHPFDLAIGSGGGGLRQPVLDPASHSS